jgi:peptidyl-prolyl cis-trans isomerase A (cyclophilin A)
MAGKVFATLKTTMGEVEIELFEDKVPKTVANFVGLATGTTEWTDTRTGQKVKKPFYDGLIFHRIIPDFMVQCGCPLGRGTGGPGYTFKDEFHKDLRHDTPGVLSMANAGPNTNGSQFFITHVPTPWLDNKHSVFGRVVRGMEVIQQMGKVARGPGDRPKQDIVLEKVEIRREG